MPGYDLIALDLDGTLLDSQSRVSEANRSAIARARGAGVRVTICTGRGLVECDWVLDKIGQTDPVIVAGGAIVACPVSRHTQHRFAIDRALVTQAVSTLLSHAHPALVLKDPLEAGYDYLVVRGEDQLPLDPVTEWWFEAMKVRVRHVRSLAEDPHPEHTVRVGACGKARACAAMIRDIESVAAGRATVHHFPAVVAPESASTTDEGDTLHVLELFHSEANKWSAIKVLSRRWDVLPERVAAIGDQINDVSMLEGAGLGIAMGNAVPAARNVADRTTLTNDEDGVALAIERILDGEW